MVSATHYMQRALELAEMGKGHVSPNPLVGCVIVVDDQIIGEGFHEQVGGPHAEVHAIRSVENEALLSQATVYVTLEPCAHYGKTPPCANLLVEKQVKKVVIATQDPNPLVAGKGIQLLKSAGIVVESGLLAEKARWQNRRFFTQIKKKRPYVILKWAQTRDGFLARRDYSSKWISGPLSRQLVHRWRAEEDAVLIGKNTAHYDNPSLTVRDWVGPNPIRIVLDPHCSLDPSLALFDGSQETLCYNALKSEKKDKLEFVKLSPDLNPAELLQDLQNRSIQSVLIEGGRFVLNRFLEAGCWDEARVFSSPSAFGEGIQAPVLNSAPHAMCTIQNDTLTCYLNG